MFGHTFYTTQVIDLNDNSFTNVETVAEIGDGVASTISGNFFIGYSGAPAGMGRLDQNDNFSFLSGTPHGLGRNLYSAWNSVTNRVYIPNSAANLTGTAATPNYVSVIDGSSGGFIANVPIGAQPFANPAINEVTNKIYIQNAGLGSANPTSISVINGATNTSALVNTSAFPTNTLLIGGIAANPTTNRIYFITGQGSGAGVIDGSTDAATPLAGISSVFSVAVNPSLNRIYYLSNTGLRVLDGTNDSQIATVAIPGASSFVMDQSTGRIFVISSSNSTLTAVDSLTNTVIDTVPLSNRGLIGIDPDQNLLFVADYDDFNEESTSRIRFVDAISLTTRTVLSLPLRPGRLAVNPVAKKLYVSTINASQRTGIVVIDTNLFSGCGEIPLTLGEAVTNNLTSSTCILGSDKANLYTFSGVANQQIAVSMETSQFFSKLELVSPSGLVLTTVGGDDNFMNARLPDSGYFALPITGTYTIRAIGSFGGSGEYSISLFEAPVQACTYSLSPALTNASPAGGSHFFDVLTQPGCPPAPLPASSGNIYDGLTYSSGRVMFDVAENTGAPRQDIITVAGEIHTINQFGVSPPANDSFGSAQAVTGTGSPVGNPVTGYNTTATTDGGEPGTGSNPSAKSVWYSWTAPEDGLYSFSTSGSSFDTVMAIYECPTSGQCTFTNLIPVGSNDDTTFFDKTSKVNFRATAGTEYRIVVDGKDGASGTIELSWRQYERLYRLYLQNYNGDQITIVPDSISASNGSNTVIPTLVSMGVYEFDLPADNTTYLVTLSGPEGIVWDPNNFPLDTSTLVLNELMQGPTSAGQNSVSNAQNQTPRFIYGFIKQIAQPELNGLSVLIGSSRGPNPRDPAPCSPLSFTSISGVPYAAYQCLSQPQTLHDIVPRRSGKKFTISVLSFENPINTTYNGTPGNSFLATNVPTHNITGQVQAGGAGTVVDLAFTPEGLNAEIALRTVAGADGSFSFPDLPTNTYKLKASKEGVVFIQPEPVDLQSDQTVNISAEMTCTYTPADLAQAPGTGGPGKFTINTNDPTCAWQAKSEAPWIVINSGVGVGSGPVHFTVLANDGSARTGGILISGLAQPISIEQSANIPGLANVSGQILTPSGQALRNASVSITDSLGNRRTILSSSLGFYSFDNVATGENHTIRVNSKRYRFQSRTVNLTGNLSNVDFVGLE